MRILLVLTLFLTIIYSIYGINAPAELKVIDTSHQLLSRDKRWLVWKEGVNWIAIIFGIGIPFEVDEQSVVLGLTAKAYYQLPDNSTYYTNPDYETTRKKRTISRWMIYELIENFLERNNYPDGKACLLKSICEISAVRLEERSGLLAEIVHTIFTPSSTKEDLENHGDNDYHVAEQLGREIGNCNNLFPECPMDPIQQFSRFMTLSKYMY